jgi:hypothetical protein
MLMIICYMMILLAQSPKRDHKQLVVAYNLPDPFLVAFIDYPS